MDVYRELRAIAERYYARRRFSIPDIVERYRIPPDGVLHIGANLGSEAADYARCGFERVLWVEGFPSYYERLKENLRPYPNQSAFCFVASDRDGQSISMRSASNTGSTTIFEPTDSHRRAFHEVHFGDSIELTTRRPDSYFREHGISLASLSLLVLDVEGAELLALRGLGDDLSRFRWLLVEVSFTKNFDRGPLFEEIDAYVRSQGFTRRRTWIGEVSGDALYERAPSSTAETLVQRFEVKAMQLACRARVLTARRKLINIVKALVLPAASGPRQVN